jgi:hypothetical protein
MSEHNTHSSKESMRGEYAQQSKKRDKMNTTKAD